MWLLFTNDLDIWHLNSNAIGIYKTKQDALEEAQYLIDTVVSNSDKDLMEFNENTFLKICSINLAQRINYKDSIPIRIYKSQVYI